MSGLAEPDVAAIYRAPPASFIAERDALARRLEDEGRDADASAVKRLRKPTVAAWALNVLAGEEPDRIADLLASGAALQDAQRRVMAGEPATALHGATAARRAVVAELAAGAARILRDAGTGADTHREDLEGMLEAASVEPEAGERLRTGTIEKTVRPSSGLGLGLSLVDAGGEASGEPAAPARSAAERAQALDEQIAELGTTLKGQERAAAKAETARDRAAVAAETAQQRSDTARGALREAEATLGAAQLELRRTRRTLERAEKDRSRLR